jgi:4-hydroxybenzoate polyprenyltransferase
LLLGMAVACWIAGFDSMYACQDIEFDRANNLHSIPARFGEIGALRFSALFHFFTVIFLIANGLAFPVAIPDKQAILQGITIMARLIKEPLAKGAAMF